MGAIGGTFVHIRACRHPSRGGPGGRMAGIPGADPERRGAAGPRLYRSGDRRAAQMGAGKAGPAGGAGGRCGRCGILLIIGELVSIAGGLRRRIGDLEDDKRVPCGHQVLPPLPPPPGGIAPAIGRTPAAAARRGPCAAGACERPEYARRAGGRLRAVCG